MVFVEPDISTIKLLDKFETLLEDGTQKYRCLVLRGWRTAWVPGMSQSHGWVNLVVERGARGVEFAGILTFTDLKRRRDAYFNEFVESEIRRLGDKTHPNGVLIPFAKPFILRGQNSTDLAGWHLEGGLFVIRPGTEYGETTRYHIVGMYVGDCWKCNEENEQKSENDLS